MPEMNLEIERKFLIDRNKLPYNLDDMNGVKIKQGYLFLCSSDLRNVFRLRRNGDKFFMTMKIGRSLSR